MSNTHFALEYALKQASTFSTNRQLIKSEKRKENLTFSSLFAIKIAAHSIANSDKTSQLHPFRLSVKFGCFAAIKTGIAVQYIKHKIPDETFFKQNWHFFSFRKTELSGLQVSLSGSRSTSIHRSFNWHICQHKTLPMFGLPVRGKS